MGCGGRGSISRSFHCISSPLSYFCRVISHGGASATICSTPFAERGKTGKWKEGDTWDRRSLLNQVKMAFGFLLLFSKSHTHKHLEAPPPGTERRPDPRMKEERVEKKEEGYHTTTPAIVHGGHSAEKE